MTRIPVDVSAPIACTATADELSARIDQLSRLRDELRSIERTTTGLVLHFDAGDGLERRLEHFATEEKGCCRFWGFEVRRTRQRLTLVWDGPPDAQAFLDELDRSLRSDQPRTALDGLL